MSLQFYEAITLVSEDLGRRVYDNYMGGSEEYRTGICIRTAANVLATVFGMPEESIYSDLHSFVDKHFEYLKEQS